MPGHYSSRRLNIVTSSAPVGIQYPQAAGTALAYKIRGEDGVVLVCGGEASTSGGDWHEAMNFAGIHDLPLVFLVENNVYAISVHAEVPGRRLDREAGRGLRLPGHEVDGNDVLAVYEVEPRGLRSEPARGSDPHRGEDLPHDSPPPTTTTVDTASARRSRRAPEGPHRPLREVPDGERRPGRVGEG